MITRPKSIRKRPLLLLAGAAVAATTGVFAQAPPGEPPSPLPIRQVTLFTSGVAYTERAGAVTGNATVPLVFHTAQINDILKSMVLLDRGGKVQAATYASRDPIGRTLQGFAVDVSDDLSQAQLLEKLRGANVSVETAGKASVQGQIIGVEERQAGGEAAKPITATFLNLLTETGLVCIKLDADRTVRILDTRLNSELHTALTTLAGSTDKQRRQVTLHFAGAGRRDVHVAYVMEAPVWKISYRLLIGGEKPGDSKPYLQGWALVENTTDEDWKGVRLSLVSGRPVSFIQDLYQPIYIPRPEVGPDVVASPYPQTHDENLQAGGQVMPRGEHSATTFIGPGGAAAKSLLPPGIEPNDLTALSNNNMIILKSREEAEAAKLANQIVDVDLDNVSLYRGLQQLFSKVRTSFTIDETAKEYTVTSHLRQLPFRVALETLLRSAHAPLTYLVENGIYSVIPKVEEAAATPEEGMARPGGGGQGMRKSVTAQATGARAGELFKYTIDSPVSLPRRQAAMIPVIAKEISADRLSLFNADMDGGYALNTLRIHNNTGLHLKGGPITLFDGGTYAGDAKMEDVGPGDTRLVSYAVDLSLACSRDVQVTPAIRTTVSVKRGLLTEQRREQIATVYTLKSKTDKPKSVLVEHPYISGYSLMSPSSAAERTAGFYRFAVTVAPRKTVTLKVVTERTISNITAIGQMGEDMFSYYSSHGTISAKLKSALQEVLLRRKAISDLNAQAKSRTAEIAAINDDQERIRKNMEALDKSSSLYKRYVSELDAQETSIGVLRRQSVQLLREISAADQSLKAFEDGMTE